MTSMKFGRAKKKELTCADCGARAANKHVVACERCGGPIREMNAGAVKEHRASEAQLTPAQQASVERLLQIPGLVRKRATDAIAQLTTARPKGDGLSVEQVNVTIDELTELHAVEPRNDVVSSLFHMARNPRGNTDVILPASGPGLPAPVGRVQRLCCDQCGLPFWINELVVRGGLAKCSGCAGPKEQDVRRVITTAPERTGGQEAWDVQREVIEAAYDAAMTEACPPGTMRKVAARVLELTAPGQYTADPIERKDRERNVFQRALQEIAPGIAAVEEQRKEVLAALGLRPLGTASAMLPREEVYVDTIPAMTAAAARVDAHWKAVDAA